jgi:NitT/TauT family transport system ATP-binding protein
VQANIRVALQIARPEMGKTEQSAAINRWLAAMGIGELAARYPLSLSGGQQQRVAIARAFALMPQLMLLDEPFSALDALTREKLQRLFLENWQANPTTALFVTHDVEEAVLLGEKILLMPSGEGGALTLLDNPLFALPLADKRESEAFFEQTKRIRKVMQEKW